jgi:predicted permease
MGNLWQEARYALRLLAKAPGFTFTSLLSMALGIGATTAVFSVIHAVLVSPYPYSGADRMVQLVAEDSAGIPRNFFLTGSQFRDLQRLNSVESAIGQANWELATTDKDLPEDVRAIFFTTNVAAHFGVPALLGRNLLPSDAEDGQEAQPVVVLSYSFWKRRFSGRPDVVGKVISMGHQDYTIVGVLPPRFAWVMGDVYLPMKITNDANALLWLSCVKLKHGITLQAAEAEFEPLLRTFAAQTPAHFPERFHIHLTRLTDEYDTQFAHMLYLLFAAVGVMLWIGCANFSILLLARGASREHELAVRSAIGASRFRVLRQLLLEAVMVSLIGGALGVLVAYAAVAMLVQWLPQSAYPREVEVQVNLPVLAFSVGLALVAGLLSGLSPALRLSRKEAKGMLLSGMRSTGTRRANRAHGLFVIGQVAMTLVLLSIGGAAAESFLHLLRAPLGYDPRNTLIVGIPLQDNTFMKWGERAAYFDALREKVVSIAGVQSAAIAMRGTPPANGLETRVTIAGSSADDRRARLAMVSPEYFPLLHISLLSGRIWNQIENRQGVAVAVVNETMARRYWPGVNALGQTVRLPDLRTGPFRIAGANSSQPFEIIGVVADVRNDGLGQPVQPAVYVPYTLLMEVFTHILVETRAPFASIYSAVRGQVRSVNADQQVEGHGEIFTLESLIERQGEWQQAHLVTILLGAFGVFSLVLALVGLYSIVSYGVEQRTNEFGIRMALGAQQRDVLKLVFGSASVGVAVGLAFGFFLSFSAAKVLAHWTTLRFQGPLIPLAAALLFLVSAASACMVPALRASSIEPMDALRRP